MKKISILCLTLFSFLFSQSQIRYLKGTLQSSQEVPETNSNGSGVVIVKYDMATKTFRLYGDYAGLTKAVAAAHIHEGAPGVEGPVLIPLTASGDTTGTLTGTGALTKAQEDSLLAGNMYANVHTSTYQNGELRAQLTLATDGATTFLSGRLQGAQETPPDTSLGTGSVYALLDFSKDSMFVTGNYTGLTGASGAAHVHLATPDSAGPVLFAVHHSFASSGVVHAVTHVSTNDAATIAAGGSYLNVHTNKFQNGEIRAQLINNATGRYFAGEFSGTNEAQPNASKGRGVVVASYDPTTRLFQLAGDYQHLTDTITRANLITPSVMPGDSIALITTRDSTGTITDFASTLSPAQEADLTSGLAYVNIVSPAFPNGEIRANLTGTTPGESQAFAIKLSPTQEVPILGGTAFGNALVLLDKTTGKTYVTGAYQGLNSAPTRAYIRGGAVGDTSGSVFLDLTPAYLPTKKSGTFSGTGTISNVAAIDSMINGLSYVNILSSGRPTGAVRGQLGDLVLPVKLTYFNGYKQRNQVELMWETSEELNVSRYEIEQLNTKTQQWTKKGSVPAKGGSTAASYSFTDAPNTYESKYVLYRLKMIDRDGKVTYSSLVKVNFENLKAELFIQTNPVVNGELKFTITGLSTNKKAEVSIIDYNGRLMLRNTVSSLINNTLRIPKLSAGMYKLVVRIDDTLLQKSFIK